MGGVDIQAEEGQHDSSKGETLQRFSGQRNECRIIVDKVNNLYPSFVMFVHISITNSYVGIYCVLEILKNIKITHVQVILVDLYFWRKWEGKFNFIETWFVQRKFKKKQKLKANTHWGYVFW